MEAEHDESAGRRTRSSLLHQQPLDKIGQWSQNEMQAKLQLYYGHMTQENKDTRERGAESELTSAEGRMHGRLRKTFARLDGLDWT